MQTKIFRKILFSRAILPAVSDAHERRLENWAKAENYAKIGFFGASKGVFWGQTFNNAGLREKDSVFSSNSSKRMPEPVYRNNSAEPVKGILMNEGISTDIIKGALSRN